ncbi:hypothetical protein SO802_003959 [Lithocarpus litseifolius]|uniref:Uncharacterized protein n=1 Tax=Lithocarpus litseifolius TaxID=425828 RepID=A0AAW2E1J8_9ROSI
MMTKQACSKPIELCDNILPRVLPFDHHTVKHYGKNSFTWLGPRPCVNIMSPEHIKDVFTKIGMKLMCKCTWVFSSIKQLNFLP